MKFIFIFFFLFGWNSLNAQVKIGVVDSQKVLEALPYRDSMMKAMDLKEKELIAELTVLDSLHQTKYTQYVNRDHGCFESPDKPKNEMFEIQNLQQEILRIERSGDSLLGQMKKDLNEYCDEKLRTSIEQVMKSEGLSFILYEHQVLFYKDQLDITGQVIQEALKLK